MDFKTFDYGIEKIQVYYFIGNGVSLGNILITGDNLRYLMAR